MKITRNLAALTLFLGLCFPAVAQIPGQGVTQSGAVVADNCAKWVSNNVIADAGTTCGGGGGSGTVTTVSVVTANGVSGSVANPTTTPAITVTLGAITPTTVNGNTLTTGTGTLTLGAGKTATVSNTLTFTGTDSSSVAFGTGGTVLYANQTITLTGDVTGSGTTAITTVLANIPTATPMAGSLLATNITAPGTPASGKTSLYVDSTDKRLHDKNDAGTIGTTVVADTGTANNYISAISAAGVITKSRPTCSTLSDAGTGCSATIASYMPLAGGTFTGGIGFSTTNTLDIGTSATVLAPRTVYAGTSFVGPIGTFTTSVTTPLVNLSGTALVFQSAGVTGTINWAPATSNKAITLPNGTTDFTATGGTSQVLKQVTAGAAITVAQLACADLSNAGAGCSGAAGSGSVNSGTTPRLGYYATSSTAISDTPGLTYDATNQALVVATIANPAAPTVTLTGGAITGATSYPLISGTQTWNNATTSFRGILLNFVNTASAATSQMIEVQSGGVTNFTFFPRGAGSAARFGRVGDKIGVGQLGTANNNSVVNGFETGGSNLTLNAGGNGIVGINGTNLTMTAAGQIGFAAATDLTIAPDTMFTRAAAANVQLGAVTGAGAAVAQTLSVQGSSLNSGTAALFTIAGSDQSGTGTTGGAVTLRAGNTSGASGTRTGGALTLAGGTGATVGGTIVLQTAATTSLTTALTIGTDQSLTAPGPISFSNATVNFTALGNVATTSAVCYNTGTGLLTYNSTVGTCTVSDGRLKNVDGPLTGSLAKLLQIKGVYYHWKDPAADRSRQIGVIAQDVEKVFPELVSTDSKGTKSADYLRLTAPIIEALRELKAANDNLARDVALLKAKR